MKDFEAGGLNLHFFDSPALEPEHRECPEENARIIARNMLRLLMMKWQGNGNEILSFQLLQAVFIKRNPVLLAGMRHAFREGFDHIWSQLKAASGALSLKQNNQAELFISNCLCFLPFSDPTYHDCFYIPRLIHENWRYVAYQITPIELTVTRGVQTFFMRDNDRVFAYGLAPCDAIEQQEVEPILIFMGTTYPSGQGFVTQINTDLEGFETAGSSLYHTGHERVARWLDKQSKKTRVCGTSLGGSLALLLAVHQGEKLSRVDALNPAGLYDAWSKHAFDDWANLSEKPEVLIQKQGQDFVSRFGVWKEDWKILSVIPKVPAALSIFDHAQNYAGHADTIFQLIDAEQDNQARRVRNAVLYSFTRGVVYYLALLPYHYMFRPVLRYAHEHATELFLLGVVHACLLLYLSQEPDVVLLFIPVALHVASKLMMNVEFWMGGDELPLAKLHERVAEKPPCFD